MEFVDYNNNDIGFHYSTEEQWTGKYWIDGKKIYSKTFFTNVANLKEGISHGITNIGSYRTIDYSASFWNVNGNTYYPLSNYESSSAYIFIKYISNDIIKIDVGLNWESSWSAVYVTINYTKNE